MSTPPWVHKLGLNNHLELGPNCPDEEDCPTCDECPDHDCAYGTRST